MISAKLIESLENTFEPTVVKYAHQARPMQKKAWLGPALKAFGSGYGKYLVYSPLLLFAEPFLPKEFVETTDEWTKGMNPILLYFMAPWKAFKRMATAEEKIQQLEEEKQRQQQQGLFNIGGMDISWRDVLGAIGAAAALGGIASRNPIVSILGGLAALYGFAPRFGFGGQEPEPIPEQQPQDLPRQPDIGEIPGYVRPLPTVPPLPRTLPSPLDSPMNMPLIPRPPMRMPSVMVIPPATPPVSPLMPITGQ
jgi:hypothetical protein